MIFVFIFIVVQSPKTDCSEAEDTEDDCREIERTS